eukprot:SAG31_NODE_2722_length_5188_cov_6.223030_8_plen_139_part_01
MCRIGGSGRPDAASDLPAARATAAVLQVLRLNFDRGKSAQCFEHCLKTLAHQFPHFQQVLRKPLERMFVVRRMFGAIRFGECSALVGEGHFDSGKCSVEKRSRNASVGWRGGLRECRKSNSLSSQLRQLVQCFFKIIIN